MPSMGYEPVIPATKWLQPYILDCMATGNGHVIQSRYLYYHIYFVIIHV